MRSITGLILLISTCCLIVGCEQMKFQQPKWDWWKKDKPVQPDPPADIEEPQVQEPMDTTTGDLTEDQTSVDPKKSTVSPELAEKIRQLEAHRDKVWKQVCMLQEIDTLSADQQADLKRRIIEQLDEWYAPMPVSPPNTNEDGWTDLIIWDFMPEADFQQAVANWRQVARDNNKEFPANVTRRQLLEFIDGMLKPAKDETNQPTNESDKEQKQKEHENE